LTTVKIAHLADLHLGLRQYHRQTPGGINQREADVANAFRKAVDSLQSLSGEPVTFDPQAALITVSANIGEEMLGSDLAACQCLCGTLSSCGGGGGGH